MATSIKNPSIEPTTLPYPLAGVLAGLQTVILSADYADVVAALGTSTVENAALLVSETSAPGPYDDADYGGVLTGAQKLPVAIGPYSATTAASQTNTALAYGAAAQGFVAPAAGFLGFVSARLSAAVTGANIVAKVAINGTEVNATALTFAPAGATTASLQFAPGAVPFAAGDVITVTYTTLLTTNTPTIAATVGIAI